MTRRLAPALLLALLFPFSLAARDPKDPTWWDKYQFLLKNGSDPSPGATASALSVGANVDVSNECGPQSETFITINPSNPSVLATDFFAFLRSSGYGADCPPRRAACATLSVANLCNHIRQCSPFG